MNNKSALLAEMHHGSIIITPNNRLSNQLLRDYCKKYMHEDGSIKKPNCLPYMTFLQNRYTEMQHLYSKTRHPILLTNVQQSYLWQQLLAKNTNQLFNSGLLNQIQDAWKRCQCWGVKFDNEAFQQTAQTKQFQQWAEEFQNNLSAINAITSEQLVEYLAKFPLFNEKVSKIIWVCFDDYTPEQRSLQKDLEKLNYINYHFDNAKINSNPKKYIAKDKQDEFKQMFAWIKNKIKSVEKQIAIVIPNLEDEEKTLKRLLNKEFPNQFNISLGKSLIQFPLIAHALQWLQLETKKISNHQARLLLTSPYLMNSKSEFLTRSDMLQESNLLTNNSIYLSELIDECKTTCPKLAETLSCLNEYPKTATPKDWVNYFKERLTKLGFPGEYPLPSASYQAFNRLLSLFDDFQQLAIVNHEMDENEALKALTSLANESIFQLQQPTTPIIILGLLEASGCTFDSIWMCNLNDKCLPNNTNFSAFIPISLQRELLMPHASTERELEFATKQLERLQNSCNDIVFSYASFIDDIPMLACPLINDLPILTNITIPPINTTTQLIEYEENYQIPLDTKNATGGTYLLANQAKCPFKAFAAHRLYASSPKDITEGQSALERGQLIHKIMELLWIELGSQKKLMTMNQNLLDDIILKTILTALNSPDLSDKLTLESLGHIVEIKRLKRLINASLVWERTRPEFKIFAIEQKFSINLADINFQVRVDRIDEIRSNDEHDNKKIVIDYKSSLPSSKPWNEDRPEEPQLLLYSLLDQSINTILFMELKAGNITVSGLSEEKSSIKGISSSTKELNWKDSQNEWYEKLLGLAEEFKQGLCSPNPSRASLCTQCCYKNLCRTFL